MGLITTSDQTVQVLHSYNTCSWFFTVMRRQVNIVSICKNNVITLFTVHVRAKHADHYLTVQNLNRI